MRLLLIGCVLAGVALAAGPEQRTVDFAGTAESTVRYTVVHKFHTVEGTSKDVTARARLLPGGGVQFMARVPVSSFDSGNGNRDEHMKETVDAARFPYVEVKAVSSGLALPTRFPATITLPLHGQVTFHGVTQPLDTSAKLIFTDAQHVTGDLTFPLSLTACGVERPSLAFIKVEDQFTIAAHLAFTITP